MMNAEQLAARLRKAGHFVAADLFMDERGLAFITGASLRTVREWRARRIGPPAIQAARWLYDLETAIAWLNRGGFVADTCNQVQEGAGNDMDTAPGARSNQVAT